jgi:thioredoxin reductase (NADPH)
MVANEFEVLVIGGGPAGLSAALYLARFERQTALIDAGSGRSTWYQTAYNLLGFPGGIKARELRDLGRRQLAEYAHISLYDGCTVDTLERDGDWFVARNSGGKWRARALILCMGVRDHWPEFEGWQEYVGRSMFWCITCDGYTCRDQRMLITGNTNAAAATTLQLQRFSSEITLLTNSDENHISAEFRRRLEQAGIPLVEDRIASVTGHEGYFESIHTVGGKTILLDCLFNQQGSSPRTDLAKQLGVKLNKLGYIVTDSEQRTNIPGVFAAGDLDKWHNHQITTALHEGGQAACAANYYLYPAELKDPE